ncbi:MAG: Hsp20/alpha crystallin family protein [Pleurocapsa minor GSE-CHR-MK-17-07R]|nr:Hsp20/alpha crystallin family protein [Pleurocapsa minor GSE-CHR-MK 17-07R]
MATIVRWNPIREMAAMQNAMDRFFDDSWRSIRSNVEANLDLDIHDTDAAYLVTAALPGVKAENVQVNLHDNVLTISAETMQETRPENSRALILERAYGKQTRSVRLPQPVLGDKIEAVLDNGVLTLTLPKSPEAQPRAIPVRVGTNLVQSNN